jgi:menaquinone-specific isochorismate synthase
VSEPAERELLTLSNVSHIYSKVMGRLKPGISVGDVILRLHPTPAVCGSPRDGAIAVIRESESFARGWYAGPFGVIGNGFSDISVAIRSALVSEDRVALFAGAGIVSQSEALNEWQELEDKIAPALATLGGNTK